MACAALLAILSVYDLLGKIVNQLFKDDKPWSDDAFALAMVCRDFRAVICLKGSTTARFPNGICTPVRAAVVSVARLRWALCAGYTMCHDHMWPVAKEGRLDVLQCMKEQGCDLGYELGCGTCTCNEAAEAGHLHVLIWAKEIGLDITQICYFAARGGKLHVLQWARDNACEWNEGTCAFAAAGGHLHVLQWAMQHGCPWDESTHAHAASEGHWQVVEWAIANGCPQSDLWPVSAPTWDEDEDEDEDEDDVSLT